MRSLLSSLVAAALTFDAATAVDIVLFPTNSSCLPGFTWACANVAPLTCCRPPPDPGFPYFSSAQCTPLTAGQTCTVARVFKSGAEQPPCGTPCGARAAAAAGPVCVSADGCWGSNVRQFGAYWAEPASAAETECQGTVDADRVGFANGRAFRIGEGVPAGVVARLAELARIDPQLARGVPDELAPFEITAAKGR